MLDTNIKALIISTCIHFSIRPPLGVINSLDVSQHEHSTYYYSRHLLAIRSQCDPVAQRSICQINPVEHIVSIAHRGIIIAQYELGYYTTASGDIQIQAHGGGKHGGLRKRDKLTPWVNCTCQGCHVVQKSLWHSSHTRREYLCRRITIQRYLSGSTHSPAS